MTTAQKKKLHFRLFQVMRYIIHCIIEHVTSLAHQFLQQTKAFPVHISNLFSLEFNKLNTELPLLEKHLHNSIHRR